MVEKNKRERGCREVVVGRHGGRATLKEISGAMDFGW
jgi:hypothetical protein